MEVNAQFVDRLRRELADQLAFFSIDNETEGVVLTAFDRAAIATVLNGGIAASATPSKPNKRPKAGSQAAKDRARKAAETRRVNRDKALGEGGGQ